MQTGTVWDLWCCLRSWRPWLDLRENFVHIWKSHVCSQKLDVQKTHFCLTHFDGIWNYFSWMQVYAWMEFPLLICGIWLLKCCILLPTNLRNPKRKCRETCCMTHHQEKTPTAKLRLQFSTTIVNYATSIMFRQTWALLVLAHCFTFLKIMKRWSRWWSKAEVPQWDTCAKNPQICAWWVFRQSQLGPKNPNQICWHQKPTTRRHTDKVQFHTWRVAQSSPSVQYQHFSALPAAPKRCRKMQEGTGEDRIVAKSKPTLNLVSQTAASSSRAPSSSASNRPGILKTPSLEGSNLIASAGNLAAGGLNQNDAASTSQVWQRDTETNESARKLAAAGTNQDLSFFQVPQITDDDDSEWPNNFHISRAYVPHLEKVCSNLRQQLKRNPKDKMEDLDVSTLIWRMFMTVTLQAAVHLGNDYSENLHSTENQPQRTVKPLFDVTKKLVRDQKEIQGISVVDWHQSSWKRTTLLIDRAVRLSTAKAAYSPTQYYARAQSVKIQ